MYECFLGFDIYLEGFDGTHCKAGPHRIGTQNTSKGINRYFLRIYRSNSDIFPSKNEVTNSVLDKYYVCVFHLCKGLESMKVSYPFKNFCGGNC
jgi:hypothetical protein